MGCKIGLALGGGGARALAHIGVIKVLQEHNIPIHCISGTSMGGIIAAALASGISIDDLEKEAIRKTHLSELIKLIDLSPPRRGLLEGNRVRAYLKEFIGDQYYFEDLSSPLSLNAVDLLTGQEINFTDGELLPAIFATICMPGLFTPLEYRGYRLIDGGVLNNLPVNHARSLGADFVIAIDPQIDPTSNVPWQDSPDKPSWPIPIPPFVWDFYWAEFIMVSRMTNLLLDRFPPNILIRPAIPPDITMFFGFTRASEIIETGIRAGEQALPKILEMIG